MRRDHWTIVWFLAGGCGDPGGEPASPHFARPSGDDGGPRAQERTAPLADAAGPPPLDPSEPPLANELDVPAFGPELAAPEPSPGFPAGMPCSASDECLPDLVCGPAVTTAAGAPRVCLAREALLCKPCASDAECSDISGSLTAGCVDYGSEGHFCGLACAKDLDCPGGYVCQAGQCMRAAGTCLCAEDGGWHGASTACFAANDHGSCVGERSCVKAVLEACSAPKPAPETCDGLDNDCDGAIDGLLEPCYAGAPGTAGVGPCLAGAWSCQAGQWGACEGEVLPAPEICFDGIDQNCDGQVDEGCVQTCVFNYAMGFGPGASSVPACTWVPHAGSSTFTMPPGSVVLSATAKAGVDDGCALASLNGPLFLNEGCSGCTCQPCGSAPVCQAHDLGSFNVTGLVVSGVNTLAVNWVDSCGGYATMSVWIDIVYQAGSCTAQ